MIHYLIENWNDIELYPYPTLMSKKTWIINIDKMTKRDNVIINGCIYYLT